MKRLLSLSVIVLAVVAGSLVSALTVRADDVDLHRLLHGPQRCDHVISLLHRHGVNNGIATTSGINGIHPLGQVAIPAAELGDLQLVTVTRHPEVASGCGPAFDLVIKNCSTRDVCGARMTLVALFGRIHPLCPNVTATVDSIPAGQAVQVTLTLPIESLAMGNLNGQVIGFNRILVVVDSFDQFMECNEANNLRLLDSASIPLLVVTEVTQTTEVLDTEASAVGNAAVGNAAVGSAATGLATGGLATQGATAPSAPAAGITRQATPGQVMPNAEAGVTEKDLQSAINQFSNENAETESTTTQTTNPPS